MIDEPGASALIDLDDEAQHQQEELAGKDLIDLEE